MASEQLSCACRLHTVLAGPTEIVLLDHDGPGRWAKTGNSMYGPQGSGYFQSLGASAGGTVGLTLAFAAFDLDLPASGTGPVATAMSFAGTMAMSALVAASFICFVVAFRLVVKHRISA